MSGVKQHIDALCKALKEDKDYWNSWQANIAMACYDALRERGLKHEDIHIGCNVGASRFLDLLTLDRVTLEEKDAQT